jgi:hypothetical protein
MWVNGGSDSRKPLPALGIIGFDSHRLHHYRQSELIQRPGTSSLDEFVFLFTIETHAAILLMVISPSSVRVLMRVADHIAADSR